MLGPVFRVKAAGKEMTYVTSSEVRQALQMPTYKLIIFQLIQAIYRDPQVRAVQESKRV